MVLTERFGVSERRACRVIGQPRSTQRLPAPVPTDYELALRAFLRAFFEAAATPGMAACGHSGAARRAGRSNNKRIHRLWRRRACGCPTQAQATSSRHRAPVGRPCPIRPTSSGPLDFQFDQTRDGGC